MKIEPLGDAAYLIRDLRAPAYEVAAGLNAARPPGLIEAVASYETVGLYVEPEVFDPSLLQGQDALDTHRQDADATRMHRIPVCYEMGPDLNEAAGQLKIAPEQLVRIHSGSRYRCYAVGFCPGFPYLGYLNEQISGLPRRGNPRVRVEPGSVAITGRQTGIYPLTRPGGWWLIGKTPLTLVEPDTGYFPIEAGDEVEFVPIDAEEFARRQGERL